MGTQFSSRLNESDKQRILTGIRSAWKQSGPSEGGLTASQRRRVADAHMRELLAVAERHHFFDDFLKSPLFVDVFEWLVKLQSDARFNEFRNKIEEYGLAEAANPVVQLTQELRKLIDAEDSEKPDPFRASISAAARIVLAEAAARQMQGTAEESPATRFGRKLAATTLQDLVSRFMGAFIGEFFANLVSRADPDLSETLVSDAVTLSREGAERIGRRVVKRIENEGQLAQAKRIHEILVEELQKVLDRQPSQVPAGT
jgi:hypothetical protein